MLKNTDKTESASASIKMGNNFDQLPPGENMFNENRGYIGQEEYFLMSLSTVRKISLTITIVYPK